MRSSGFGSTLTRVLCSLSAVNRYPLSPPSPHSQSAMMAEQCPSMSTGSAVEPISHACTSPNLSAKMKCFESGVKHAAEIFFEHVTVRAQRQPSTLQSLIILSSPAVTNHFPSALVRNTRM